jgi:hypothetical protein
LRKRLRRVDDVIAAVAESGVETRSLSRAIALPKEHEMEARGRLLYLEMNIPNDQINTRRLVRTEEDLGRVFTRFQSGQRSVSPSTSQARVGIADFPVDITGEPKGILGYHCTFTFFGSTVYRIHSYYIDHVQYHHFCSRPALSYSIIKILYLHHC